MVVFRVNGKTFHVPDEEVQKWSAYIKAVWDAYPSTWSFEHQTPNGYVSKTVRVPANFKSQSFTYELALWAERNWEPYVVVAEKTV